ncbi:hypothetical protein [Microbacterium sp. BK668]|uniref:hypothetical protein n=1 Tax=Microbacterium sp. BK668 TaxID=2512118 RepID=UPI00105E85E8|nr:hypothetical protein [Microbacterium sp. BK668]TDN92304.1 collagen triple helix repeat protein [Microbacterium sp. BK668]
MSEPTQPTPPITKPSPTSPEPPKRSGVGLGALIGVGVAVIVLSFVAAFLGSSLARSADAAPEPTATAVAEQTPVPTPRSSEEIEDLIQDILPAGSAVRAGQGAPAEGKGYPGDVYIDVSNADVYVFRDGQWVLAGNIKQSAAENLTGAQGETGATGAQGEQGEQGEQGAQGEAGTPGTQVLLGSGAPDDDTCQTDGDIYIDTSSIPTQFYSCADGSWQLSSSPTPSQLPSN